MTIALSNIGVTHEASPAVSMALRVLCKKYHIRSLRVFGSVLHRSRRDESDIDLLMEFASGYTTRFAFVRLAGELSKQLGVTVDLHTEASLSKYFRHEVVQEAQVLYADVE